MNPFWLVIGVVGLILQCYVIYLMTKGLYRSFPWIFLYLLVLFLTGVADFGGLFGPDLVTTFYSRVYYVNNTMRHLAALLAVVSLFLTATADQPERARIRIRVLGALAGLLALSFAWNFPGLENLEKNIPTYLGTVGRDMGFITALLILTLWFALIRQRSRNRLLFLVSSGMGLNMAGEAISVSISILSSAALDPIANVISVGSHFLCLLIWIRALQLARDREQAASTATSH